MAHYSVQPRGQTFVKGHRLLPFAKKIGKNMRRKYSQKLNDYAKQSATDVL